jgi:hypothetical protein
VLRDASGQAVYTTGRIEDAAEALPREVAALLGKASLEAREAGAKNRPG